MKSMQPPSVAIFFMTNFDREWGGGGGVHGFLVPPWICYYLIFPNQYLFCLIFPQSGRCVVTFPDEGNYFLDFLTFEESLIKMCLQNRVFQ